MGVLDFLFEGSPPPSVTTYGSTTENMPQWYSDYTQALIARANQVAGEGYQPYQGPRVAGFNDDQRNAWDVIRNNIGGWNDEFDTAKNLTSGALTQALPYAAAGSDAISGSMASTPSQIEPYLNPYTSNVIDRAKTEAMRTWNEDLMPQISSRFITGGQSGSTAHQEKLQQGARDVTEGINSQALAALSDAYNTAGTQYQNDATRNLSAGQALGALGTNLGNLSLQSGQNMGVLSSQGQDQALKDAGALEAVGSTQQQQAQKNLDTAYGDFQNQVNYPKEMTDWMSSVIRGIPTSTTTTTTDTGPGNNYQPSPLSQLISLYGLYKDVTKARGGVVRKAHGGRVEHIEGPIEGYLRYAEGGPTRRLGYRTGPLDDQGRGYFADDGREARVGKRPPLTAEQATLVRALAGKRGPLMECTGGRI